MLLTEISDEQDLGRGKWAEGIGCGENRFMFGIVGKPDPVQVERSHSPF